MASNVCDYFSVPLGSGVRPHFPQESSCGWVRLLLPVGTQGWAKAPGALNSGSGQPQNALVLFTKCL